MHGLGNDYILMIDLANRITSPGQLSKKLSHRHMGIGGDGLILIRPSQVCDFKMEMYNADGSEGEMCGNGIRCVGKLIYEQGLVHQQILWIETTAGARKLSLQIEQGTVMRVQVDMGVPEFAPLKIPVVADGDLFLEQPVIVDSMVYSVTCVSMGNPHAVLFLEEIATLNLPHLGGQIEQNPLFPNRINVEFVQIVTPNQIHMRVWERGAGETMACGTGACAAVVAGVLTGRCARNVSVSLPGGILEVCWEIDSGHVQMTGPVEIVFEGEAPDDKD